MTPLLLQTALAQAGFYPGPLNGLTDQALITAVKDFQAAHGFTVDGIVGRQTLAALPALHTIPGIPLTLSPAAVDLVKAWEGCPDGNTATVQLNCYVDQVGVVTWGYGHAIKRPDGSFLRALPGQSGDACAMGDAIMEDRLGHAPTRDDAKAVLSIDLNDFAGQVARILAADETKQEEFDALTSFAFNLGASALQNSTLKRLHERPHTHTVAMDFKALSVASKLHAQATTIPEAFGSWSNAGGKWALGLFRRRMAEALVYEGDAVDLANKLAFAIAA